MSLLNTATAQAKHLVAFLKNTGIFYNANLVALVENKDDLKNDIAHIAKQIAYKEDKKLVIGANGNVPDVPEDTELMLSGRWKYGYGVESQNLHKILQLHRELNLANAEN